MPSRGCRCCRPLLTNSCILLLTPRFLLQVPPPALARGLAQTNALLSSDVLPKLQAEFPGRARFVDCGPPFSPKGWKLEDTLHRGKASVDYALMPDGVHPSVQGSRLLADCIGGAMRQWRRELLESGAGV